MYSSSWHLLPIHKNNACNNMEVTASWYHAEFSRYGSFSAVRFGNIEGKSSGADLVPGEHRRLARHLRERRFGQIRI